MPTYSISGNHSHSINPVWSMSEKYLSVGQKKYKVSSLDGKSMTLELNTKKSNAFVSAVKIGSWVVMPILPLSAYVITKIFRVSHKITVLPHRNDAKATQEERLDAFVRDFNSAVKEATQIKKSLPETSLVQPADIAPYFVDLNTYVLNQQNVHETLDYALQTLLSDPSEENKAYAKGVMKQATRFFRSHIDAKRFNSLNPTDISDIGNQHDTISSQIDLLPVVTRNKLKYGDVIRKQNELLITLQVLRKQVILKTKEDKIRQKMLNVVDDPSTLDSILPLMHLTWLHGTKSQTVSSALEHTEGEILPYGELKKRHVKVINGELGLGIGTFGINHTALSGVSLDFAGTAERYAKGFEINHDLIERSCRNFLNKPVQHRFDFNSVHVLVEDFKKLKSLNPTVFNELREAILAKTKEIQNTFDREFLLGRDEMVLYDLDRFHTIINASRNLQALANEPETTEPTVTDEELNLSAIPVVFGCYNFRGIPLHKTFNDFFLEETRAGALKLGTDIRTIFVDPDHEEVVSGLMDKYSVEGVEFVPMDLLKQVQKVDNALTSYYYDIFKVRPAAHV